MKKYITLIIILTAALLFPVATRKAEKRVDKIVQFSVHAGSNYNFQIYNTAMAAIKLSVYKYSCNKKQLIWEKTIDAKQLSKFPGAENAMKQKVIVHNVKESSERIEASFQVIYNSKGNIFENSQASLLEKNKVDNEMEVAI
ncbi:MAG: hypothetical protein JWN76_404 [Chitinophagaceae bacterium]|nr:hypothetical protein [Chitinophagaceae bacterium]